MKTYIKVNKELIPYYFNIALADEIFTLEFNYNRTGDFFTVALRKDGELISAGEKLVYGVPLWQSTYISNKHPCLTIVPLAENADGVKAVTYDNLEKTVFLVVDDEEG